MKQASQSVQLVFDVLAVVGLLFFAMWITFISLLIGPGYWGPTVGLLMHASTIGAVVYILEQYGKAAQRLSRTILVLLWIFGLPSVIFGFAPGHFIELGTMLPKMIMFGYPILFFLGVQKKEIGGTLFRITALMHCGLSTGLLALLVTDVVQKPLEVNGANIIVAALFLILSFIVFYPLYHLLFVGGLKKKS